MSLRRDGVQALPHLTASVFFARTAACWLELASPLACSVKRFGNLHVNASNVCDVANENLMLIKPSVRDAVPPHLRPVCRSFWLRMKARTSEETPVFATACSTLNTLRARPP